MTFSEGVSFLLNRRADDCDSGNDSALFITRSCRMERQAGTLSYERRSRDFTSPLTLAPRLRPCCLCRLTSPLTQRLRRRVPFPRSGLAALGEPTGPDVPWAAGVAATGSVPPAERRERPGGRFLRPAGPEVGGLVLLSEHATQTSFSSPSMQRKLRSSLRACKSNSVLLSEHAIQARSQQPHERAVCVA